MAAEELRHRLVISTDPAPNRLANNFLPPAPKELHTARISLEYFSRPSEVIHRAKGSFEPATITEPGKGKLKYTCDEKYFGPVDEKSKLNDMFDGPDGKSSETEQDKVKVDVTADQISPESSTLDRVKADIPDGEAEKERLYNLYHPGWNYEDSLEDRVFDRRQVKLWKQEPGTRFLLHVEDLVFGIGAAVEPFFCSFAIFDFTKHQRLSEDFHFDLNTDAVLTGPLHTSKSCADETTLGRDAVFSLEDKHRGIFLVLRIERVLQGDPEDVDIYCKEKARSKKEIQTHSEKVRTAMNRLGGYRQAFAFAALPLFDEYEELAEGAIVLDQICAQKASMSDKDFIKHVSDSLADQWKHSRLMPNAQCKIRIKELFQESPVNLIDPSGVLLAQEGKEVNIGPEDRPPIVREVKEFNPSPDITTKLPQANFTNLLYIYPQKVHFQKYRNIACKVEVYSESKERGGTPMQILMGRSSSSLFVSHITTAVTYHDKAPAFSEEVKVALPLSIPSTMHVLFTFMKISVKKKPNKQVEELIGYSVLPLTNSGVFAQDGAYDLAVVSKLPPDVLSACNDTVVPSLEPRMNGQKVFQTRLHLESTVLNQDVRLGRFISEFPDESTMKSLGVNLGTQTLKTAVDQLNYAEVETLVKFLPSLLDFLLNAIASDDEIISYQAFVGLCVIVKRVTDACEGSNRRNPFIAAYIFERFRHFDKVSMYLRVSRLWMKALNEKGDSDGQEQEEKKTAPDEMSLLRQFTATGVSTSHSIKTKKALHEVILRYNWFLFEIVLKSMVLERHHGGLKQLDEWEKLFEELVFLFATAVFNHSGEGLLSVKAMNENLAIFMNDLFSICNRDTVVDYIEVYLTEFREVKSDATVLRMCFHFLDIVMDHEDVFTVLRVADMGVAELESCEFLIDDIKHHYGLCNIVIESVIQGLQFHESSVRKEAVDVLRRLFTKVDYSDSWSHMRQKIATAFLPILPQLCSEPCVQAIVGLSSTMQRNVLACFLFVTRSTPETLLHKWLSKESHPHVGIGFVHLLELCVYRFRYHGFDARKDNADISAILAPEVAAQYTVQKEKGDELEGLENMYKMGVRQRAATLQRKKKTLETTGTRSRPGTLVPRAPKRDVAASFSSKTGTWSGMPKVGRTAGKSTLRQMRAAMQQQRKDESAAKAESTLTINSREYLTKLLILEASVNQWVARAVLRSVALVLDVFEERLHPGTDLELNASLVQLLTSVLQFHQSTDVFRMAYHILSLFVHRYGVGLMQMINAIKSQLNESIDFIFTHCAVDNRELRSHALSIVFLLIKANYKACSNIDCLQESLTTSLSKMVPKLDDQAVAIVRHVIEGLQQYADIDADVNTDDKFRTEVTTLIQRMHMILKSQVEVIRQRQLGTAADPAALEHLFMLMAEAFSHVVEIRVEWMNRLASHHYVHQNWAEAAQCYIALAQLFKEQYIQQLEEQAARERVRHASDLDEMESSAELTSSSGYATPLQSPTKSRQDSITTWHKRKISTDTPLKDKKDGNSRMLRRRSPTRETLVEEQKERAPDSAMRTSLKFAVKYLDQATLYEQCLQVYKELMPMYEEIKDYGNMSAGHTHLASVCSKLRETSRQDLRMLGTYYRVGFYGKAFGDQLDGHEYVYKMPKITRLPEVVSQLQTLYSEQLGVPVQVKQSSHKIDPETLDPEACVMQVTFLNPRMPTDDHEDTALQKLHRTKSQMSLGLANDSFFQTWGVKTFTYSTPFTQSGKSQGDVTEQYKRITVLHVADPFPYVKTAQRVVEREESVLNPIQSAVQDIATRSKRMRTLLKQKPIDTKSLTGLLAGSVATQVNEGATYIAKSFLDKEKSKQFKEPELKALRSEFRVFLQMMQLGLESYKAYMDGEPDVSQVQKDFIQTLGEKYQEMCSIVEPLLKDPKKRGRGVRFHG